MAEHGGSVELGNATGDDYEAHRSTYEAFVGLTKYGTIALIIVILLMTFFLL
jgi:hypothetical protein